MTSQMLVKRLKKVALVCISVLAFFCDLRAQTITIGSGTTTNGVATSCPVNIAQRKTVCQMVYTVAELNAAGITGPKAINKLGFFVANPPIYSIPGYTISMKHTTATNAGGNLEGGYTIVKSSFNYSPGSNEWDLLTLTTPFMWNGTQNLVIRICWSQVTPGADPSGQVRTFNAASGYKYRAANTGGTACGLIPSNTFNTKPQIRFIFDTTTTWLGTVSTAWANAANWSSGLPNSTMHARIPTGTPFAPLLSATGTCKNLYLEGPFNLSGTLNVHGNIYNTGTFNDLGGITKCIGTEGAQFITTVSEMVFENFYCENQQDVQFLGPIRIDTELRVNRGVLHTNDLLTINSDATLTGRINEIKTSCKYTLVMNDAWGDGWNGGYLSVFEDGVLMGTYAGEGFSSSATFWIVEGRVLTLTYTAGTYENENSYTLYDQVMTSIYNDPAPLATGLVFTQTAAGCNFQSTIDGNITMRRYIEAGDTWWRYFSSAVEDPTLAQYNDDFLTAGYPGSGYEPFPFVSVYTYDETLGPGSGYVPASSSAQVIGVGEGVMVYCGDTITGTLPFVVDLTGPANQGDISLPVSYTFTGTLLEDGYSFIGNPYASTIDWDASGWVKTNVDDAIYIMDPETQICASYVAGAGTNGGTRYVASQQSFWVYANAAGPSLIIEESCKSSNDAYYFKTPSPYSPGMNIKVSGFGKKNECVVRHLETANDEFDGDFDAYEIWAGWGVQPQISLVNLSQELDLAIHSFDFGGTEWAVPLRAVVFESGMYQLTFDNVAELDVPCLQLEDTYTGTFYDIEEDLPIWVELSDTSWSPRFLIHIGANYESDVTACTCTGSTDGQIELDLNQSSVNYEITHEAGTTSGSASGDPLVLNSLESGIYSIEITDLANLCGNTTFNFTVNEPSSMNAISDIVNCTSSSTGSIDIEILGGTAPYSYNWSSGPDTNFISGLSPGIYTLTVTDANGCEFTGDFEVVLVDDLSLVEKTDPSVWFDHANNTVTLRNWPTDGQHEFLLYGSDGRLVEKISTTIISGGANFNPGTSLSAGMYILSSPADNVELKLNVVR